MGCWPCSINFHGRNLSSIQSTCPLSLSTVSPPGYTFLLPRSETPNPLPWAHDRPCWLAVMACNACEDLLWKAIECLTWPSSGQGLPLSCCLTARNGVNYSTERVPHSSLFLSAGNGNCLRLAFRGCKIVKYFPTLVFHWPRTSLSQLITGICAFQTLAPINLLFQALSHHFKTHIPNPAALRIKNSPGTTCTLILRNN